MRAYAVVLPSFWTGSTGKAITAAGKNARIVATYLLTCEHANMIGLYRLPSLYIAEETGLKRSEVLPVLQRLETLGFAHYDQTTEYVWVLEMARIQMGLLPGESLKEGDKRSTGAARLYKNIAANPFLGPFYTRYSSILGLTLKREFLTETKPPLDSLQGASEPLARGYDPDPSLNSLRKGEMGETKTSPFALATPTPEEIKERWNTIPGVKPCKVLGSTIRDLVRRRLAEHPDPRWWDDLLKEIQDSDFLCGRTKGKDGPFPAPLNWVLESKNLDKILAGNYEPPPKPCQERIHKNGSHHSTPCGKDSVIEISTRPLCQEHKEYHERRNNATKIATT
ncbi:MAG: hypothetical protein NDI90_15645 [Nitrospira sp. BO4]|jgi:hypothetical protein|nr:hypothetical protein [Nitrospira sp. BO4]